MKNTSEQTKIGINENIHVEPQRQIEDFKHDSKSEYSKPIYHDQNMLDIKSQENPAQSISKFREKNLPQRKVLDNRSLDDKIKSDQISYNESQEEQIQNVTCKEKFKARKCLYIGTIIVIVIIMVIAIVLPISLSSQEPDNHPQVLMLQQSSSNTSQPKCEGVPQTVCNYIHENYNDTNQILSLIQTSRSLSPINSNNPCNATRQNLSQIYKNIFISVQCLALNFPNNYIQVYQKLTDLQFTTQKQVQKYLNMTQSFSGRPIKLIDQTELAKTCRFNATNTRRRLQQGDAQTIENKTYETNCSSNATSVLIFIDGIGYGPSSRLQNILKIKQITSKNDSTKFDGGIVSLGAWRIDKQIGYFSKVVKSYEKYLEENNSSFTSRYSLYLALKSILNSCVQMSCLPPQISQDQFLDFWAYYQKISTQSFDSEKSFYQYSRHRNFISQQIIQGKKVVILAHGQGSAYSNNLYDLLTDSQKQNVKLVYIAPTIDTMPDGSTNYITNSNDTIISIISEARWSYQYVQTNLSTNYPLDPNLPAETFDQEAESGSNHKLVGYAKAYKQEFTFLIVIAKISATQPEKLLKYGPIMVKLQWYQQVNLNIHIIEPDGTHVYFYNAKGLSGYIQDFSYTDKTEYYYTSCKIKTGNYTVFVHYAIGSYSVTGFVKIYAGSQFQSYYNSQLMSRGDIFFVASIQAKYDEVLEIYEFKINPY